MSSSPNDSILLGLLVLTGVIAAAFLYAQHHFEFSFQDWKLYLTLAFFAISTWLSHRSLAGSIEGRPTLFANKFLASIVFKLLLSFGLFIGIVLASDKEEILPFGALFLVCYITYTVYGSRKAIQLNNGAKTVS